MSITPARAPSLALATGDGGVALRRKHRVVSKPGVFNKYNFGDVVYISQATLNGRGVTLSSPSSHVYAHHRSSWRHPRTCAQSGAARATRTQPPSDDHTYPATDVGLRLHSRSQHSRSQHSRARSQSASIGMVLVYVNKTRLFKVLVLSNYAPHIIQCKRTQLRFMYNLGYIQAKLLYLFSMEAPSFHEFVYFDDTSLYSTTDQMTGVRLSNIILQYVNCNAVVTDATSCIGGTTLVFAHFFRWVNAVEIDENRCNMLRNNLLLANIANVSVNEGDYTRMYTDIQQDVVFLDPPWGGVDYRKHRTLPLMLGGVDLAFLCAHVAHVSRFVFIKVPFNYDYHTFASRIRSMSNHTLHSKYVHLTNRIQLLIVGHDLTLAS